MDKLFLIHGLMRSGNHAVINWIMGHHDRFIFFNDIIRIEPVLSGKKDIPAPEDVMAWVGKNMLRWYRRGEGSTEWPHARPRSLWRYFSFSRYIQRRLLKNYTVLTSLEDHDVRIKPFRDVPQNAVNLLIVRDPYSWLSSRIRIASRFDRQLVFPRGPGPAIDRVIQLWKRHAYEALDVTQYLENKVCVYFNSWFADRDYRRQLSAQLGFNFSDRGYSCVASNGGGSSFDGIRFNGENTKMNVLRRKEDLRDEEKRFFDDVMKDEELHDLAKKLEEKFRGAHTPPNIDQLHVGAIRDRPLSAQPCM